MGKTNIFKKQYRDLEMRVHNKLRDKISKSSYVSKHTGDKAVAVNSLMLDYEEVSIINGGLCFLDEDGHHYSIFAVSLEDLIDIIND